MRICFVLPCAGTRGAPRSLLETIDVLQKRGSVCFAILPVHGPLIQELNRRGVETRVIKYKLWTAHENQKRWKRITRPILNLPRAFPIARQIKRWNCDLVYTNTVAIGIGAFAARLAKLPHVWHIREFGWEDHRQPFDWGDRITGWILNRYSDLVITNSQATLQKFGKYVDAQKIKRAHQAVRSAIGETSVIVPPAKRFRCVIVGALIETKGQADAVRAMGILKKKGIDCELQIIGGGPEAYRQTLHQLVAMNGIHDRVEFVGYVNNSSAYLRAADVVLVCSRCEAFGRVTVEGMLAGKPVIGSRSGGTAELLVDGFNGFGYEPGDADDLAEKIAQLRSHPADAAIMGENAANWAAAQFNLERYGEEMWSYLKPLVPGNGAASLVETPPAATDLEAMEAGGKRRKAS
jgi:glycosyltransferase involved in cell wall biosynthesis